MAEYLAATGWVEELRENEVGWIKVSDQLDAIPGFPETLLGILVALRESLWAVGGKFDVPDSIKDWVEAALAKSESDTDNDAVEAHCLFKSTARAASTITSSLSLPVGG